MEHAPSVADPLDDAAFMYFVRTIPLEVGKTYDFNRYFRPDRNPVQIRVLRKETIKVPAGTYQTIVIQPIIKSKGIFSEKGHAEMWLTDDSRRLLVQMKTRSLDRVAQSLSARLRTWQRFRWPRETRLSREIGGTRRRTHKRPSRCGRPLWHREPNGDQKWNTARTGMVLKPPMSMKRSSTPNFGVKFNAAADAESEIGGAVVGAGVIELAVVVDAHVRVEQPKSSRTRTA